MRSGLLKYCGQSSKQLLVASLHFLKDNIQIIMNFSFASSVWNTLHCMFTWMATSLQSLLQ